MKTLKDYARDHGIKYRAAWNRFKAGKISSAFKDDSGKILIQEDKPDRPLKVVCYARVSSSQSKADLETQAERIMHFADLSELPVHSVIKKIGSGLNDKCPELLTETDKEDLMQDFVSPAVGMAAGLYGLRQSKRKTEQLIKELGNDKKISHKS